MGFLVFLMPLLSTLPIAVAAVIIARLWLRNREHRGDLAERVAELQASFEALRSDQAELQERVDFSERLLAQFRDQARISRPAD